MIIKSLDPRITRAGLDTDSTNGILEKMDHFQTYEVFHQEKEEHTTNM